MPRHGLIISYYFPPSGGGGVQRWTKFIKYLSRWDWQFTVITKKPGNHEIKDKAFLDEIPASTEIINLDSALTESIKSKSTYWKRWLSAFYYITDSRKHWNKIIWNTVFNELSSNKYDVVFCTIPPYSLSEITAKISNHFKNIPVILDMRDPWTTNPYKIHPTSIHLYLDKKNELKTINQVKNIVYAYESTLNFHSRNLAEFHSKKCKVVSNGYDEEDFSKLEFEDLPIQGDLHIGFSGTFYSHLNIPKYLFQAMSELKSRGVKIYFHHIGNSVYSLKKLAAKYGIEELVTLWGYKSHKECLKILNSLDAFVVILDPTMKNAEMTAGGKLYEYLRFKKPILGLVPENGEVAKVINETKSGIVCSCIDSKKIAESILNLKNSKITFTGIEKYSRENLAKELNNFVETIIK